METGYGIAIHACFGKPAFAIMQQRHGPACLFYSPDFWVL
jgi:hypothetical protein